MKKFLTLISAVFILLSAAESACAEIWLPAGWKQDRSLSGSNRKGDLYVKLMVQIPSKLSGRQRELLQAYMELENPPSNPDLMLLSKLEQ